MKTILRGTSKIRLLLAPILVTLYAILALLATNIYELQATEAFRPLLISIVLLVTIALAANCILHDFEKASALTTLFLILFFSYGHVYLALKNTSILGVLVGRHRFLLIVWTVVFAAGVYLILRRKVAAKLLQLTGLVAGLALIFPLVSIGRFFVQQFTLVNWRTSSPADNQLIPPVGDALPDIYYIILDSYARQDILSEIYGFDNSDFTQRLASHGFYVAAQSIPNHVSTAFSLASSLNMDYIQDMDIELPKGSYPLPLIDPIRHSLVREQLESLGYHTIAFATGSLPTNILDADLFISPEANPGVDIISRLINRTNSFERLLLQTTLAKAPIDMLTSSQRIQTVEFVKESSGAWYYRELVQSVFDNIVNVPDMPGANFVFAHLISPHRPYVFSRNGDLPASDAYTLSELKMADDVQQELDRYHDQMLYINDRVLDVVSTLIEKSDVPPIIIIQADHGPAFNLDWFNPDARNLQTKAAILNVYYLPPGCESLLYPGISPVNSFRVVFDCVFSANYPLLEDHTYFSNHHDTQGYEFTPIEDLLQEQK